MPNVELTPSVATPHGTCIIVVDGCVCMENEDCSMQFYFFYHKKPIYREE